MGPSTCHQHYHRYHLDLLPPTHVYSRLHKDYRIHHIFLSFSAPSNSSDQLCRTECREGLQVDTDIGSETPTAYYTSSEAADLSDKVTAHPAR